MSSKNIHPIEDRLLARHLRESSNKHKGGVFWLCGLSGSGKSTLALLLEKYLFEKKIQNLVIDGDNVRSGLCQDLGFSIDDRKENVRRVSEMAKLMARNGFVVIVSLISPTKEIREYAKKIIGKDDFFEIFVKSSFEKCKQRDVKGLYAKVDRGKIDSFTGKDSAFEDPTSPWLLLDTENTPLESSMTKLSSAVINEII
jgi:adenylylsulfate kinase